MQTLNKIQQREVAHALARLPILGADYAARCISALHRAAARDSQKRELYAIAQSHNLIQSADFII